MILVPDFVTTGMLNAIKSALVEKKGKEVERVKL
jgi:hypothetical protein